MGRSRDLPTYDQPSFWSCYIADRKQIDTFNRCQARTTSNMKLFSRETASKPFEFPSNFCKHFPRALRIRLQTASTYQFKVAVGDPSIIAAHSREPLPSVITVYRQSLESKGSALTVKQSNNEQCEAPSVSVWRWPTTRTRSATTLVWMRRCGYQERQNTIMPSQPPWNCIRCCTTRRIADECHSSSSCNETRLDRFWVVR